MATVLWTLGDSYIIPGLESQGKFFHICFQKYLKSEKTKSGLVVYKGLFICLIILLALFKSLLKHVQISNKKKGIIIVLKSSETKKSDLLSFRLQKMIWQRVIFLNGHIGRHVCIITLIIMYRQALFRIQDIFLTVFTNSPVFLQWKTALSLCGSVWLASIDVNFLSVSKFSAIN